MRSKTVLDEVEALYLTATTTMGAWMWRNHTQWVAGRSKYLAEKYGAHPEKAYCAGLLHDLGDSRYERGHADFDAWAWETSKDILRKAEFRHGERKEIMEAVRTHSCHPGHLPVALEGKVLATADAMWHLQTSFFPIICYMNRPEATHTYPQWQQWFQEKIERDFHTKIFFEEEQESVREDYAALIKVFGNKSLQG